MFSSPPLFYHLIFLLPFIAIPTQAGHRHIISIPAVVPHPSGIAWDPIAQHFVVGSTSRSIISSVSDAGVAETIVSDSPSSSSPAVAVDSRRRRLLVTLRNPDAIASYDLQSPRPHRCIFSSSLPAAPGGVAVDSATGFVFVTGSDSGVLWRVDLEGNVSEFSRSPIYSGGGLGAVAYMPKGFLLVIQGKTGRVFKVDEDNGAAKEVIGRNGIPAPAAEWMAVTADGAAVVAGGRATRMVRSDDGWAEAAVKEEVKVEEGKRLMGVTMRQGKRAYVLLMLAAEKEQEEGKDLRGWIEEVEWEDEDDMVWAMVLVGLGLAVLLFWRFQMRQLVSGMNKKRA